MKAVFVTGKGGVGKSTLAAALAWQLAERGQRVEAVSFDPAHNLGDIFGVRLSHRPRTIRHNLSLRELDAEEAAARYVRENVDLLRETYGYLQTLNLEKYFTFLKYSPGVEECAAITSLEQLLRDDAACDYLVFDTPPTGLTLRILALPRVTLAWLERLIALRHQILDRRHTIHKIRGERLPRQEPELRLPYNEADDRVMEKLKDMRRRYTALRDFLCGSNTAVAVVFNPDMLSLRESERLLCGIRELELPFAAAIHNKCSEATAGVAATVEAQLLARHRDVPLLRVPTMTETAHCYATIQIDLTEPFRSA
jgi:arsenite/tail-anchored protein-transporting ATPase